MSGWIVGRKALAAYLDVSVRQVARFRELGAPIVFMCGTARARPEELDDWIKSKDQGRCPKDRAACPLFHSPFDPDAAPTRKRHSAAAGSPSCSSAKAATEHGITIAIESEQGEPVSLKVPKDQARRMLEAARIRGLSVRMWILEVLALSLTRSAIAERKR